jgi:hypothetical protein
MMEKGGEKKGNVLALRAWGCSDVEDRIVNGRWRRGSLTPHNVLKVQYYPVQT